MDTGPFLKDKHFEAFGRIIYGYASVEVGLKFFVAAILKIHPHEGLVICAPYPAFQLASVTKSLARDNLKPKIAEKLCGLVDRWTAYTPIRTYVAHHRWRNGKREWAIRPTYVEVKTGHTVIKGFEEDEKDYTPQELFDIGNNISTLNEDMKAFLKASGLEAIIDRKMAEESAATEASEGAAKTAVSSSSSDSQA